jgi:hypothetical protein
MAGQDKSLPAPDHGAFGVDLGPGDQSEEVAQRQQRQTSDALPVSEPSLQYAPHGGQPQCQGNPQRSEPHGIAQPHERKQQGKRNGVRDDRREKP